MEIVRFLFIYLTLLFFVVFSLMLEYGLRDFSKKKKDFAGLVYFHHGKLSKKLHFLKSTSGISKIHKLTSHSDNQPKNQYEYM